MSDASFARPKQSSGQVILIPKQLRMDWTDVMALDAALSNMAFRAACVIGSHFNRHRGDTFITLQTIARVMAKSERVIWSAIQELEGRGYLLIKRREFGTRMRPTADGPREVRMCGGKGVANTYLPAFQRSQVAATNNGLKLAAQCDLWWEQRSQKPASKVAVDCDPTLTSQSKKIEKYPTAPEKYDLFPDFVADYGFEPWMARRAAERIFKRLSDDEQVAACAGARHYAADCSSKGRIKQNAKTWLIDRGWEGFVPTGTVLAELNAQPTTSEFYFTGDDPRLAAWDAHRRVTHGNAYPRDRNGGWRFSSEWPPGHAR